VLVTQVGKINAYRTLVEKFVGKRKLVRPRRREDNIKMDASKIGCGDEMDGTGSES
jgi:hypothetical protein